MERVVIPLVSVVMSTFCRNHRTKTCDNLLKRAIRSVVSQDFTNFEFIIVDDGSTDGTQAICKAYSVADSRIKHVRFENNSGCPAKRYNDGMAVARGDYFMFMFDDDFWYPGAIKALYGAITGPHKRCGMVYGMMDYVNALDGTMVRGFGREWDQVVIERDGNFLGNLTVVVSRDAVDAVGGYNEASTHRRLCDWDLWVRIGRKFPVARIPVLIGRSTARNPDSVGMTIPLLENDILTIRKSWDDTAKRRLQGEVKRKRVVAKSTPKITFVLSGHDAVLSRWSVAFYCDAINRIGGSARTIDVAQVNGNACDGSDIVVMYRAFNLRTLSVMRRARTHGVCVAFMLDDYVFQPDCKYTHGVSSVKAILEEADCFVSPSEYLLSKMPNKPKILRRNVLDPDTMGLLKQAYRRGGEFNVGWIAGPGRGNTMDKFVDDFIAELDGMLSPDERCVFRCFGRSFESRSKVRVETSDYFSFDEWRGYYSSLSELDLGVVINPLDEKDEFWWCKSEVKFVESGAMGVPIVTARVPPYLELIKDGENGLFASTPAEYAEQVVRLIRDEELSRRISAAAYAKVVADYDVDKNASKFVSDLVDVVERLGPRMRSL